MDKKMTKKAKKRGFSILEGIIMLTVAALAIAALAPTITKKHIITRDAGETLSGGSHGRYEAYVKEKLVFDNDETQSYEKFLAENPTTEAIIYKRVDDGDTNPANDVYEELKKEQVKVDPTKDVKPYTKAYDENGKVYTKSYRYIFEDAKIEYKIVKYKDSGKTNAKGQKIYEKVDINDTPTPLPTNKRIIESRLVKRNGTNPQTGNPLWKVEKSNVKLVSQPWEKLYSGKNLVIDRPIYDSNGKAKFQTPKNASVTIHAVGGGGAGGGLDENLGFKNSLQGPTAQTKDMLYKKFKENLNKRITYSQNKYAAAKTSDEKHKWQVEVDRLLNLRNKVADSTAFPYITIENGIIRGEFDVQLGYVFPHDVLYWDDVIPSDTQEAESSNLYEWFSWDTLKTGGTHGKPFPYTVMASASSGGNGGSIIQNLQDKASIYKPTKDCIVKNHTPGCTAPVNCNEACSCSSPLTSCETGCYESSVYDYTTCYRDGDCLGYSESCYTSTSGHEYCYDYCNEYEQIPYRCPYRYYCRISTGPICTKYGFTGGNCANPYYECSSCPGCIVSGNNVKNVYSEPLTGYSTACGYSCRQSVARSKKASDVCNGKLTASTVYNCAKRTDTAFPMTYTGGHGGAGGDCVYASLVVTEPTTHYPVGKKDRSYCTGSGTDGHNGSYTLTTPGGYNQRFGVSVGDGSTGTSCFLYVENSKEYSTASTIGGEGGLGARQAQNSYFTPIYEPSGDFVDPVTGEIRVQTGTEIVYETNEDGTYKLDANGNKIAQRDENNQIVTQPTYENVEITNGTEVTCTYKGQSCNSVDFEKVFAQAEKNPDGSLEGIKLTYTQENGKTVTVEGSLSNGGTNFMGFDSSLRTEWKPALEDGSTASSVKETYSSIFQNTGSATSSATKAFMKIMTKTNSSVTQHIHATKDKWLPKAKCGTYDTRQDFPKNGNFAKYGSTLDGDPGYETGSLCSSGVPEGTSIAKGSGSSITVFNEKYTWETPFKTKFLAYGEAGRSGEYNQTTVKEGIEGEIEISLGFGGTWKNDDWKKGKKGPNGTDTVVKVGNETILLAKGGQGGKPNVQTSRYSLCFINDDEYCMDFDGNKIEAEKSTKEIKATNPKASSFEQIKSLVGNSTLIGIGVGRGAEGVNTRSLDDRISGTRIAYVSSDSVTADVEGFTEIEQRTVYKKTFGGANPNNDVDYVHPSLMEFKGGDGAVIITW